MPIKPLSSQPIAVPALKKNSISQTKQKDIDRCEVVKPKLSLLQKMAEIKLEEILKKDNTKQPFKANICPCQGILQKDITRLSVSKANSKTYNIEASDFSKCVGYRTAGTIN